ncbi:F-box protein PP2-B10-like [Euphorbia lathyris]|uniref:F-box protein PP2-B10-like n=1 Tax=Euphorbia lathyris TaxID=212925 RepID=UPI00331436A5
MESMPGVELCQLPENCIATIFSFSSPKDVGRFSLVCSVFKSVSESDAVWRSFIPCDYQALISQFSDPSLLSTYPSAKDLYLRLSSNPIIFDNGKKSFGLDKWSGKKMIMLSARDLIIEWSDTVRYWEWSNAQHKSRFAEVAGLINVYWLEIRGKIKATMLSPETHYTAHLVYRLVAASHGLDTYPVEVNVGISGAEGDYSKRSLYLDPRKERRQRNQVVVRRVGLCGYMHAMTLQLPAPVTENNNDHHNHIRPKERQDGWLEIELGDYFNRQDEVGDLEISILETNADHLKNGLLIQGIDIRPKSN